MLLHVVHAVRSSLVHFIRSSSSSRLARGMSLLGLCCTLCYSSFWKRNDVGTCSFNKALACIKPSRIRGRVNCKLGPTGRFWLWCKERRQQLVFRSGLLHEIKIMSMKKRWQVVSLFLIPFLLFPLRHFLARWAGLQSSSCCNPSLWRRIDAFCSTWMHQTWLLALYHFSYPRKTGNQLLSWPRWRMKNFHHFFQYRYIIQSLYKTSGCHRISLFSARIDDR